MPVNRIELIGLTALILTASLTIALAQNTTQSNEERKYHQSDTERKYRDPTAPSSCFSRAKPHDTAAHRWEEMHRTGLPCTGPGPIAVTAGAGTLPGTTAAPGAAQVPQSGGPVTPQPTSVFGSSPSC